MLLRLTDRELLLGEEIIGNIDDNGYLSCSIEDVIVSLNEWLKGDGRNWAGDQPLEPYSIAEGEELLELIQSFDPSGVGARDLRECLLIQLQDSDLEDTRSEERRVGKE